MLENNIQALIKILENSKIDELEVSTFWGRQKIRIRKSSKNSDQNLELVQNEPSVQSVKIPNNVPEPTPAVEPIKVEESQAKDEAPPSVTSDETVSIKAPLVGTYYNSPKPGSPPFIKEGDVIQEGQVLCIIEAMKIFNEIESEISGKVVKMLVQDATPVEYDQDLIVVAPK